MSILCPVCNSQTQQLFQKHSYWICECPQCHHRCTEISATLEHINKVYSDSYFFEGGDGYPDYLKEAELLISHGKWYGRQLEPYMNPGLVLDVGAAAGFILKGLAEAGWQGIGLEPNASMAHYGRSQLGVEIEVGTLENFQCDATFDLVNMVQVLPHFYNLRQALQAAARLTKPGGYWLVETWNKDSFMARMMGQNWHEYSPPSVLHFFSPDTLARLVKQFDFVEVVRGRPPKTLNSSHAKSLLQYKFAGSTVGKPVAKLFNLIPEGLTIPYPSFDLFWVLYVKKT